jgi:hypothetical protein
VNTEVITLQGGATVTASGVVGGVPGTLTVTSAGSYQSGPPVEAQVSTTGTGTGLVANTLFGINGVQITNSGSYTASGTLVATSGYGGTGGQVVLSKGDAGFPVVVGFYGLDLIGGGAYTLMAQPQANLSDFVVYKGLFGFSIGLQPPLSGAGSASVLGTVSAGTLDVVLFA